jgi:hypothetical protein
MKVCAGRRNLGAGTTDLEFVCPRMESLHATWRLPNSPVSSMSLLCPTLASLPWVRNGVLGEREGER